MGGGGVEAGRVEAVRGGEDARGCFVLRQQRNFFLLLPFLFFYFLFFFI